jgi:hypothetical protein
MSSFLFILMRKLYATETDLSKYFQVNPGIEWVTSPYVKGRCGGVMLSDILNELPHIPPPLL